MNFGFFKKQIEEHGYNPKLIYTKTRGYKCKYYK